MRGTAVRGVSTATRAHEEFASTYRSALTGLVRYFRAKGIGAEDARDLAHETVLRTLVHLRRHGRTQTDLGPLTKTIARNLLVERVRKSSPSFVPLTDADDVIDDAPEPADRALANERREAVHEALASLAPRHRRVVNLWMQGRTPAEIASTLGIKRNAADAILHRARRALASKLGPRALWGAVVIAYVRARASVRDAGQTLAAWSPSSAAAAPVGVSLAVIGLAAVLSVVPAGPATDGAGADDTVSMLRSPDIVRPSSSSESASEATNLRTVSPEDARSAIVSERRIGVGVGNTSDSDLVGVDVTLREEDDGTRGVLGPVLADAIDVTCEVVRSACLSGQP